jgi:hypothetical protein
LGKKKVEAKNRHLAGMELSMRGNLAPGRDRMEDTTECILMGMIHCRERK